MAANQRTRAQFASQAWTHLTTNDGVLRSLTILAFLHSQEVTTVTQLMKLDPTAVLDSFAMAGAEEGEVVEQVYLSHNEHTTIKDCRLWYATHQYAKDVDPSVEDWLNLDKETLDIWQEQAILHAINNSEEAIAQRKLVAELATIESQGLTAKAVASKAELSLAKDEADGADTVTDEEVPYF